MTARHKESIRQLGEQIRKVDEARIADNKRIQEALERLGETIKKMPVSAPPRTSREPVGFRNQRRRRQYGGKNRRTARTSTNAAAEEGYEYEVVSGDRPDVIAAKYKAEKINVTAKRHHQREQERGLDQAEGRAEAFHSETEELSGSNQ